MPAGCVPAAMASFFLGNTKRQRSGRQGPLLSQRKASVRQLG